MKILATIITTTIFMLLAVKCASISIDRLTIRDCARGIEGACEEVERLDLK